MAKVVDAAGEHVPVAPCPAGQRVALRPKALVTLSESYAHQNEADSAMLRKVADDHAIPVALREPPVA